MARKRSLSSEVAVAAAIGSTGALADVASTTGWMHRAYTHRSWNPPKAIELLARGIIWGSGVKPRYWAAVHRDHHDHADEPNDPHSPVQQGRWGIAKVILKNASLYREAVANKTEEDLPQDLKPDALDTKLFDRTKTGLAAGIVGHMIMNKLAGNRARMGLLSFAIESVGYVAGGNFVNSIGHGGQHPWRALAGQEIVPNPDGTYGADSASVAALTLGEGNQRWHHDHPEDFFFGPRNELGLPAQFARDSAGAVIGQLIDHGLASTDVQPSGLAA